MTVYTDTFSASNIYPSEISYSAIALTALNPTVTLSWPEETSTSVDLATRIIDVTATAPGYSITLPDATMTGTGNTILYNNKGANTFTVYNHAGVQVLTPAPGTIWQIYLTDNTTAAGLWNTLQFGAATSSANASALAGTGIVAVGTLLSQSVPVTDFAVNFAVGINDRARCYNWTGAAGTLTLPAPTTVGTNWFMYLRNSGTGTLAADPTGSPTINGAANLNFQIGDSAIIACDGSNYFTIGFGQSAVFAFNYVAIDIPGAGDYTLAGAELNRISYKFTGPLTGARAVVVPNTVQQYWCNNATTGAYVLSIKTAAGAAVTISTNERAILYCDGSGVIRADTAGIATPLNISDGGTGATTASAARINLGGTSDGIAVFTAASTAAARAALGSTTVGDAVFIATNPAIARTALGSTVTGDAVFIASTAGVARTALGSTVVGDALFIAANAPAARATLGSGTTGDALFVASTQANAWTALGVAPSGVVDGGTF